jgi:hypothetical protein
MDYKNYPITQIQKRYVTVQVTVTFSSGRLAQDMVLK